MSEAVAGRPPTVWIRNRVLLALVAAGAAGVLGAGFVTLAPNRLVSGSPVGLFSAADPRLVSAMAVLGAFLLSAAFVPANRTVFRAAAIAAAALVLVVFAAAGNAATALAAGAPPLARVSLGAGFWLLLAIASLAVVDALQRAGARYLERALLAGLVAAACLLMARAGLFDSLSLAREYAARRATFTAAIVRHVLLVGAAVVPALLIGFPLGVAAARRPAIQEALFATLNLLQTIPSVALFGLLIVPLSALATAFPSLRALGVGGIGPAPAIIALILYALLPIARNTAAGIAGVDPGVRDAGRGLGMTRCQLFWHVELPLALPLLFGGMRIVTVQTIGLAVVAALIGAGGLGSFVFEGLGQYAADLVLLGALPAILMALAADALLQMLSAAVARR